MASATTWHDAVAIVCAVLTAASNGVGVTAQHIASTSTPAGSRGWRFLTYLAHHPLWLVGWVAMGGSLVFQSLALHFAAMSVVQPLLVTELVIGLVLRRLWLRQVVSVRAWSASVVTVVSLGVFLAATTRATGLTTSAPRWVAPGAWCGLAVAGLIVVGLWGPPGRRAALWGTATAILWALEAAYIKECTQVITRVGFAELLTRWSFYAFVVCGVAGLVCEQSALHVGPLRNSQTAIVIVDPVVSVVLGAWIFHEHLGTTSSAHLVAAVGLAVALAGAGVLIRATPDTMERTAAATSDP